jgi:hypothetical protein
VPYGRLLLVTSTLAMLVGACSHEIGDSCKVAADCDPNGTRVCDLSQPGGYCTMVGCDEKSCPSSSVCIRYFPEKLIVQEAPDAGGAPDAGHQCRAQCEDINNTPVDAGCPDGGTDDCQADEICLDSGTCAKRSFETRSCARTCGGDGDCRGGYMCVDAATTAKMPTGIMLLGQTATAKARICVPKTP